MHAWSARCARQGARQWSLVVVGSADPRFWCGTFAMGGVGDSRESTTAATIIACVAQAPMHMVMDPQNPKDYVDVILSVFCNIVSPISTHQHCQCLSFALFQLCLQLISLEMSFVSPQTRPMMRHLQMEPRNLIRLGRRLRNQPPGLLRSQTQRRSPKGRLVFVWLITSLQPSAFGSVGIQFWLILRGLKVSFVG